MEIVVPNSQRYAPRVTLFGRLDDGSYAAQVMNESDVPYQRHWENAIDQVMVYISPDEEQLQLLVDALNQGTLDYVKLQSFGSTDGGTSTIAV